MSAAAFLSALVAAPQRSGAAASGVGQGKGAPTFSGLLATAETLVTPGPDTGVSTSKAAKTSPLARPASAAPETETTDPASSIPADNLTPPVSAPAGPAVGPMDFSAGALTFEARKLSDAVLAIAAPTQDQMSSAAVAPGSNAAAIPHQSVTGSTSGKPTDPGGASSLTLPVQGQLAASPAAASDGSRATSFAAAPPASDPLPIVNTTATLAGPPKVSARNGATGKASSGSGSPGPTAPVATSAPTEAGAPPNRSAGRPMPLSSATLASPEGPAGAAAPATAQPLANAAAAASVQRGETNPTVSTGIVAPRGSGSGVSHAVADPSGLTDTPADASSRNGDAVKLSASGSHTTAEPAAHGGRAESRTGSGATPAFAPSSGAAAGADTAGPSTSSPSTGSTSAAPASSALHASAAQPSPVFDPGAVETPAEPAPVMHDMAEGVTDAPQLDRAVASSASGGHGLSFLSRASVETTALLAARMLNRLDQKVTRFDMALTPEGLGKVEVSMDIEADGQLTARLAFDNPAAAAEMRGRVDELRRQLEQAGFTLGDDALEFSSPDQGGSNASLFDDGRRSGAGRAFRAGDRLALDADQPPPVWMSLKTTPEGVDVKV